MRDVIVSVIVAAYNAEKFLGRCLDCIAAQTFQKWECLVIDDGSTDRTGDIADSYARADKRFRIIHKANGGVASARQVGIDQALGKYSIHIDADDWVDSNMLEELAECAEREKADMVISDIWVIQANGEKQYWIQRPTSFNHLSIMGQMMGELYGSLWNKLIRRSCYTNYNIQFRKDVTVCEDQLVVMSILSHPIKVAYINKAYYHYDQSQNSNSYVNKETPISKRLLPLEIIASSTDISPVQDKFDNAIFRIAYHALSVPKEYCPDYSSLFNKYKDSIKRAKAPLYSKLLILLRLHNIRISIAHLKRLFR